MTVLKALVAALRQATVDVIDLTAPLSEETPVIELPPERGQPWRFGREVISHYDAAGPTVYWNNIRLSEHTGTHFDAPVHWLPGRDLQDVSQVPAQKLVAQAAVLDFSAEATADPDFLLRREHVEAWQDEHGQLTGPRLAAVSHRAGTRDAATPRSSSTAGTPPGWRPNAHAGWAEETPLVGIGVETVGTDAGGAASSRISPTRAIGTSRVPASTD